MEKKYIDSEKLIAEIERLKKRAEHYEEISLTDGERSYWSGESGSLELLTASITSLQQEQPEVDLEKEIEKTIRSVFFDLAGIAIMGTSAYASVEDMEYIARHFYELGQRTKYQQDRAEFAKLKAKEWQSGYDEGYMKGLNARKEE